MAQQKIAFYKSARGEQPAKVFLRDLRLEARQKCYSYLQLLQERGLSLPASYLKKIESGLWELRPEYGGVEYRLIFTIVHGDYYILHPLIKKTDKLKPSDLNIARQRAREVQEHG